MHSTPGIHRKAPDKKSFKLSLLYIYIYHTNHDNKRMRRKFLERKRKLPSLWRIYGSWITSAASMTSIWPLSLGLRHHLKRFWSQEPHRVKLSAQMSPVGWSPFSKHIFQVNGCLL